MYGTVQYWRARQVNATLPRACLAFLAYLLLSHYILTYNLARLATGRPFRPW